MSEAEEKAMTEYVTNAGVNIKLSPHIVKQYLVSGDVDKVTNQEVMMFLMLCQSQKLNPFLKEAYLIKYGTAPATIVTGKETFLKRAVRNEKYQGHEVGTDDESPPTMAWAEVHVMDYIKPIRVEVAYDEYVGKKRDGTVTAMWRDKPRTMLKKVALVQALREAFPEDLGGMLSPEEVREPIDITPEPSKAGQVKAVEEIKEHAKEEKKTTAKAKKGDVRTDFKGRLKAYFGTDMLAMQKLQLELGVDSIEDTPEKQVALALSDLNVKIAEETGVKDCTCDPTTCDHASFEEGDPVCSSTGAACKFG